MRWLDDFADSMDKGLHGLWEMVMDREAWRDAVHEYTKSWTRLSDFITTATIFLVSFLSSNFVTMKITVVWPMPLVISYVIWAGLLFWSMTFVMGGAPHAGSRQ